MTGGKPVHHHGSAMDRVIDVPLWKKPKIIAGVLTGLFVLAVLMGAKTLYSRQNTPLVNASNIGTIIVKRGTFDDVLATRAIWEPASTTTVDATVSGIVRKIGAKNGANVNQGDVIVTLSNPQLDMQILSERSQIADRLASLDSQDLELQKSLITQRSEIERIAFETMKAQRDLEQNEYLHTLDLVSDAAMEQYNAARDYHQKRLKLAQKNLRLEENLVTEYGVRNAQTRQISQAQLKSLKKQSSGLTIAATRSGILTGLSLNLGQQVSQGDTVATIDDETQFRLQANVDEFYLDQITSGIKANVKVNGHNHLFVVDEIKPTVKDGQFSIKLSPVNQEQNLNARRGQGINIRLHIASDDDTLILPRTIYDELPDKQNVYILHSDSNSATRTPVRFGRKNKDQVEILNGLSQDDLIISKYDPKLHQTQIRIRN